MKKVLGFGLSLAAAFGLGAADASAQLETSAFVDFYYAYNLNKEDPGLRTFDVLHNTFNLAVAEVDLSMLPTAGRRVGGRVDLAFGPNADIVSSFEPGAGDDIYRNLQQAFISVMASEALIIDAGKFVTPLGAEVIESQDNWNYSRSVLFGFAIPFYHSGLRAAYTASEQLTLTGYLVNGWNNTFETNTDKTFGASLALAANDQINWFANVMTGKQFGNGNADPEEDMMTIFDTTLQFAATEAVSLMGNFDYGMHGDDSYWGVAGYARLQAQPDWAVAGRFEWIDDSDGGFMGLGQQVQTFTATSDHTLWQDLIARFEFRFDTAENDSFTDPDGDPTQNQPTLTAGFVYVMP